MSTKNIIEACITVGVRAIVTIIVLFFLAYVLFVLAICGVLKLVGRQYPPVPTDSQSHTEI